jgi:hypothetical protein
MGWETLLIEAARAVGPPLIRVFGKFLPTLFGDAFYQPFYNQKAHYRISVSLPAASARTKKTHELVPKQTHGFFCDFPLFEIFKVKEPVTCRIDGAKVYSLEHHPDEVAWALCRTFYTFKRRKQPYIRELHVDYDWIMISQTRNITKPDGTCADELVIEMCLTNLVDTKSLVCEFELDGATFSSGPEASVFRGGCREDWGYKLLEQQDRSVTIDLGRIRFGQHLAVQFFVPLPAGSTPVVPSTPVLFRYGAIYKVRRLLRSVLEKAADEIIIVDPYLDDSVFGLLQDLPAKAKMRLLLNVPAGDFVGMLKRFRKQYHLDVEARRTEMVHDRFIIIDRSQGYSLGGSIKDAGSKDFTFSPIGSGTAVKGLLNVFDRHWSTAEVVQ